MCSALDSCKYLYLCGHGAVKLWCRRWGTRVAILDSWELRTLMLIATQPRLLKLFCRPSSLFPSPEFGKSHPFVTLWQAHWQVDPLGEHQTVSPYSASCIFCTLFQPVRTREKSTVNTATSELKKKKKTKIAIFRVFQVEGCLSECKKRAAVVLTLRFSHPCQRFEAE